MSRHPRAHHSQSNCFIEQFHWTLKTVLIPRKYNWFLSLPIILLSLPCIPYHSDYSPFHAVSGKTSFCPTDLFVITPKQDFDKFMKSVNDHIKELDFRHLSHLHTAHDVFFIAEELKTYFHEYVLVDQITKTIEVSYTVSFLALDRFARHFKIKLYREKFDMVSHDRLKPAHMSAALMLEITSSVYSLFPFHHRMIHLPHSESESSSSPFPHVDFSPFPSVTLSHYQSVLPP